MKLKNRWQIKHFIADRGNKKRIPDHFCTQHLTFAYADLHDRQSGLVDNGDIRHIRPRGLA